MIRYLTNQIVLFSKANNGDDRDKVNDLKKKDLKVDFFLHKWWTESNGLKSAN